MSENKILEVKDLKIYFPITGGILGIRKGAVKAVDGVSLSVGRGETLGIVGESGCGKSTLGRGIIGLAPIRSGKIIIDDSDVNIVSKKDRYKLINKVRMIFQDPYESLNPRHSIKTILEEPFDIERLLTKKETADRINEILENVGLPGESLHRYPHEFSGGQRQRIGIARAIAVRPELLICDEPVSALDVSIQAQIINLLLDLQERHHLSYIFISHDLSVVRHLSDKVAVMYLGQIVENGPAAEIYSNPRHPYTQALLSSIPGRNEKQTLLTGEIPSPANPPRGCRFNTRCPVAFAECFENDPLTKSLGREHSAACHRL